MLKSIAPLITKPLTIRIAAKRAELLAELILPTTITWFVISSTANEDKDKRLRAFLSCMRCEDVQSLLVPANVPQHAIILACVLRYIMTATKIPVLQKPELDAFLVTAFSPEIGNHKYLAEMTLDFVTIRGVQLATMFMQVKQNVALMSRPIPLSTKI